MGWSDEQPMKASAMKASNGAVTRLASSVKRLASYGRGRMMPALLNGFEADGLIETGEADEAVDDGAEGRDLTELHAEDGGDQIKMGHGDEAPVEGADYYENGCEYVEFLHDFSPCSL